MKTRKDVPVPKKTVKVREYEYIYEYIYIKKEVSLPHPV
jgi:hypothetical protein